MTQKESSMWRNYRAPRVIPLIPRRPHLFRISKLEKLLSKCWCQECMPPGSTCLVSKTSWSSTACQWAARHQKYYYFNKCRALPRESPFRKTSRILEPTNLLELTLPWWTSIIPLTNWPKNKWKFTKCSKRTSRESRTNYCSEDPNCIEIYELLNDCQSTKRSDANASLSPQSPFPCHHL